MVTFVTATLQKRDFLRMRSGSRKGLYLQQLHKRLKSLLNFFEAHLTKDQLVADGD